MESLTDAKESLLESINNTSDLRKLNVEQLPQLCEEIRQYLIRSLSVNPGHFASSMGAVDLIVALHYVFDTPDDRLVWDVGHQAYAHKILTGRREQFKNQRTFGGISGFPNPLESDADTFMAGHAGNSISAALGMAIADMLTPGREKRHTVAIIGDASISGGLAFEGLNNATNHPNNLLIVLNDNDMSIDHNVGALHSYLSDMTTSAGYNRFRHHMAGIFRRSGLLNPSRERSLIRFCNSVKSLVSKKKNIFEGLAIRYVGPIDGHDVIKLVAVLRHLKESEGPKLLHVCTIKGKGFEEAEKNPAVWHAPGKFDPDTGERLECEKKNCPPRWQDVFGLTLVELAEKDPRVLGITAAMPSGTSISFLQKAFPQRAFDVGISEGHAVTFAGGLAAAGKLPFVAIYSSFLQRAYDNIIHDVAIQGLPVTLCIDRAGLVGEDGVTHHGLFDIAYLRCIPSMNVASPADEETLRNLMFTALDLKAPLAIRYPRGNATTTNWKSEMKKLTPGKGRMIRKTDGAEIAILSLGPLLSNAIEAVDILSAQAIPVDVADMIWVKPLDEELLEQLAAEHRYLVTIEDGALTGGFGTAVKEWLVNHNLTNKVVSLGVADKWIAHGSVNELQRLCDFDSVSIVTTVVNLVKNSTDK